jgi:signal peptide peptidase SppA
MLNRIFSILGAQWLIHQDTAISYLPVLLAFVKGQEILMQPGDVMKPYIAGCNGPDQEINTCQRWEFEYDSIPDNSVAIIPIDGVICTWDTMQLLSWLKWVKENDRINAVLFLVNSPGGMVSQIDLLSNSIKELGKPTVALIMGMAASAAVWAISGCTCRIATSPIDMIGSIGTKTTFQDYAGMLEKIGIKVEDIYATLSTRKDEQYRAYKDNGDTAPMIAMLDFINEVFHQNIRDNMGIDAGSEVFTGAIYFAAQAQQLGLIDEINTMDYALEKAYQLGLKNKIINQSKSFNF